MMRLERLNLDGRGVRNHEVYPLPKVPAGADPWRYVTDVACPLEGCTGTIRWAENGYVPGYRICDGCDEHFLARPEAPKLIRVGRKYDPDDPFKYDPDADTAVE